MRDFDDLRHSGRAARVNVCRHIVPIHGRARKCKLLRNVRRRGDKQIVGVGLAERIVQRKQNWRMRQLTDSRLNIFPDVVTRSGAQREHGLDVGLPKQTCQGRRRKHPVDRKRASNQKASNQRRKDSRHGRREDGHGIPCSHAMCMQQVGNSQGLTLEFFKGITDYRAIHVTVTGGQQCIFSWIDRTTIKQV